MEVAEAAPGGQGTTVAGRALGGSVAAAPCHRSRRRVGAARMPCRKAVSPMSGAGGCRTPRDGCRCSRLDGRWRRASLASRPERAAGVRAADGDARAQPGAGEVRGLPGRRRAGPPSRVTTRSAVRPAALGSAGADRTVPPWAAWRAQQCRAARRPHGRTDPGADRRGRARAGRPAAPGQAQPAVHAEREGAQASSASFVEADDLEHFVGACGPGRRVRAHSMRSCPRAVRRGMARGHRRGATDLRRADRRFGAAGGRRRGECRGPVGVRASAGGRWTCPRPPPSRAVTQPGRARR